MKPIHGISHVSRTWFGTYLWRMHNGKSHRLDGLCHTTDHRLLWFVGGEAHRLDRPADISVYGSVKWIVNDHDIDHQDCSK